MNLTYAQHRALVDVSDGEWKRLAMTHSLGAIGFLRNRGLIRCDFDHLAAEEKRYTITPDGEQALEAQQ